MPVCDISAPFNITIVDPLSHTKHSEPLVTAQLRFACHYLLRQQLWQINSLSNSVA